MQLLTSVWLQPKHLRDWVEEGFVLAHVYGDSSPQSLVQLILSCGEVMAKEAVPLMVDKAGMGTKYTPHRASVPLVIFNGGE